MKYSRPSFIGAWVAISCLALLAFWLLGDKLHQENAKGTIVVPSVHSGPAAPAKMSGNLPLPPAIPTSPPGPFETPVQLTPTSTPLPASMQIATVISPATTSNVAPDLPAALSQKDAINLPDAIDDLSWAPTGDKLIYATHAGNLYWANTDGTNATLLHTYDPTSFYGWFNQRPMSNTLFLTHVGATPNTGHLDVIHFTAGQNPSLTEIADAGALFNINWWAPDRASGTKMGNYIGGEQLVTVDANGHMVDSRNIPYMQSGAVRPGGQWLAYVTTQQITDDVLSGSEPETAYLLNLGTGQRLQLSPSGKAYQVYNWSPDGQWVLMEACRPDACGAVLVRADGLEWIVVESHAIHALADAVWSPDSRHLAFSRQLGGCDDSGCVARTSTISLINVPTRKFIELSQSGNAKSLTQQLMHPHWSPNGSLLTLLTFDPATSNDARSYSGSAPAIYQMVAP